MRRAGHRISNRGDGAFDDAGHVQPAGAFYAFPNVRQVGMPAAALADRLLERAGVACLPGTAFGCHGEGYLRFSYANSIDNIKAAMAAFESLVSEVSNG